MSDNRTIFFLHIPKNSGTTLNQILARNYRKIFRVSWDSSDQAHYPRLLQSAGTSPFVGFEVVRGHYPYGLHEALPLGEEYTYFTMIRDPIKRTWSQYNYLLNDSTYIKKNPELKAYLQNLSIEDYCQNDHPLLPNHIFTDNAQVRYLSAVGDRKAFGTIDEVDLRYGKAEFGFYVLWYY